MEPSVVSGIISGKLFSLILRVCARTCVFVCTCVFTLTGNIRDMSTVISAFGNVSLVCRAGNEQSSGPHRGKKNTMTERKRRREGNRA